MWIIFRVEKYPFGLLTMIVSLEAIFLSTFVMISQNRADAKREVLSAHQWKTIQKEDAQNQHLLTLTAAHPRADQADPRPADADARADADAQRPHCAAARQMMR